MRDAWKRNKLGSIACAYPLGISSTLLNVDVPIITIPYSEINVYNVLP